MSMTKEDSSEPYVSIDEISEFLKVKPDTIYKYLQRHPDFPAHKLGQRLWRFKISEVDQWVRSGGATKTEEKE